MSFTSLFGDSWPLFLLGVLVMALGVIASIALHEVGHLLPAKLFNVRVTQYMIGFGRTLFSRTKGETEYGVKAIPLGGYISMIGMYPPAKEGEKAHADSTGLLQQMAAETRSVEAERLRPGDENRQFWQLPVWKRMIIMLGGPTMNLVIGTVCLSLVILNFGTSRPGTTVSTVNQCVRTVQAGQQSAAEQCTSKDPEAPAHAAGLEPGDTIVEFAGEQVGDWTTLTRLIRDHGNQTVPIVVVRDGQRVTKSITPILTDRPKTDATGNAVLDAHGQYETEKVGFLGLSPVQELAPGSPADIPVAMGQTFEQIGSTMVRLPAKVWQVAVALFTHQERPQDSPMSVVGVGRVAGEVASTDKLPEKAKVAYVVNVLANLNFFLFAFNLLPLLPLDGGHVFGALWEALRRRLAKLFGRKDPGHFDPVKLLPLTYVVVGCFMVMSLVLIAADIFDPVKVL